MALASYVMHRDISANIFLASVFIIQGVRSQDICPATWDRINLLILVLSAGITLFAIWSLLIGNDLGRPRPFGFKN